MCLKIWLERKSLFNRNRYFEPSTHFSFLFKCENVNLCIINDRKPFKQGCFCIFILFFEFKCQFECNSASSLLGCVSLQVWQIQDPAELSDPVSGVWGAGVRLSLPFYLHRHAFLSGCRQCRGLSYSLYHSWVLQLLNWPIKQINS